MESVMLYLTNAWYFMKGTFGKSMDEKVNLNRKKYTKTVRKRNMLKVKRRIGLMSLTRKFK